MNETHKANIQRLIKHYERHPPKGWQFNECAGGVLGFGDDGYSQRLHLAGSEAVVRDVSSALGISLEDAYVLVYSGYSGNTERRNYMEPAYKQIVPSLKQLLETGKFTWLEPEDVS